MARIKDLIAAIISNEIGLNDTVRVLAAAGHSATLVRNNHANTELDWLSQVENVAIKLLLKQDVYYKRVNLKAGMDPRASASQTEITAAVRTLLQQLQKYGELHYPFAMVETQGILFISTMDLDIIMALAREQQQMQEPDIARPKGRLFKRADFESPKE